MKPLRSWGAGVSLCHDHGTRLCRVRARTPSVGTATATTTSNGTGQIWLAIALVVIAAGTGGFFFLRRGSPAMANVTSNASPEPPPIIGPSPDDTIPNLPLTGPDEPTQPQ